VTIPERQSTNRVIEFREGGIFWACVGASAVFALLMFGLFMWIGIKRLTSVFERLTVEQIGFAQAGLHREKGGRNTSWRNARLEFRNTRAYARASLKSHRRWLAHRDSRRDRAANRLDHVTLTPGAAALAVATDTLWVPFGHKATSPHSTGWAACAGRRCHAKAAVRPIS
jgi:hypothetical protein